MHPDGPPNVGQEGCGGGRGACQCGRKTGADCCRLRHGIRMQVAFVLNRQREDGTLPPTVGGPQGHLVGHSETGWSTVDTFSEFLLAVREHFSDDDPVYLLLDLYSVHRTDEIRQLAESLNIVLIFIPPGMTDQYQPLDRRIFGVLKQYLRLLWRREYHDDPNQRFTKQKAVQLLVPAWERISPQLIIEGWTIYEEQSDSD